VSSGIAMQQGLARLAGDHPGLELGLRVGVSAGEATVEHNDWFGTPVVEAARLCDRADAGQVLVPGRAHAGIARRGTSSTRWSARLKGCDAGHCHEVAWEPLEGPAPDPAALPGVVLPNRLAARSTVGFFGGSRADGAGPTVEGSAERPRPGRPPVGEPGIGKTALTAESPGESTPTGPSSCTAAPTRTSASRTSRSEAARDFRGEAATPAAPVGWARLHAAAAASTPELVRRVATWRPPTGDPETDAYRLFKA